LTDHLFSANWVLKSAIFADTIEALYLRITTGHYANIGEKDTLFKDRKPSKPVPYSVSRTYIAHIGEYPPGARPQHREYHPLLFPLSVWVPC